MLCYAGKRGITTINYKKIFFILLRIDGNAGLRGGLLLYCRRYRGPALPAGVYYYYYFILFYFLRTSLYCRRYRGPALPAGVYYYFIYIYIGPTAHEQRGATKLLFFTFLFIYLSHLHIYTGPTADEQRGATKPSQGAASAGCRARHVHALP
jgi:hypothetical protein